jgi:2-isopropylmalate synthase
VPPEKLGNRRLVLVSTQAGRSNVLAELERLGVAVGKDDARVTRKSLARLSDRELDDIGLCRGDIEVIGR